MRGRLKIPKPGHIKSDQDLTVTKVVRIKDVVTLWSDIVKVRGKNLELV